MKVFLSWSGHIGRRVAHAWYDWLPRALQAVEPWLPEETLPKGGRWPTDLHASLRDAKIGIACLTRDSFASEPA